MMIEKHERSNK